MLLGIDIGASACRIALFEEDGNVLASVCQLYHSFYPSVTGAGQDPAVWWNAAGAGIRQLMQVTGLDPGRISGIGTAGHGCPAIPVDCNGKLLKKEEAVNASAFISAAAYIVMKLTGKMSRDQSQESISDEDSSVSSSIARACHPRLYYSHNIVGGVTASAAAVSGLKKGTPVAAGGLDVACGALGIGIYQPGQCWLQDGTESGMGICVERAGACPPFTAGAHVVPGKQLLYHQLPDGGTLRWMHRELCNHISYDSFVAMAEEIPAGAAGVCVFSYKIHEHDMTGHVNHVYFGLNDNKTKGHMVRAALEGTAYCLAHSLSAAAKSEILVNTMILAEVEPTGQLPAQIKADVTGRIIEVTSADLAAACGAALLAGIGAGVYDGFADAVRRTVKISRIHPPDAGMHKAYQQKMKTYFNIYENLQTMIVSE